MGTQQMIHAAVLHAIGQTPRYEPFPAPVAGDSDGDGESVVTVTAAALKPSDRWMANGVHYAPTRLPQVVGLDGVGRLQDGTRVAFFALQPPYGGMAEQALDRRGVWFTVPDGIDDVTAAAAYDSLLRQVAAGEIAVDVDPVPLADVEKAWPRPEATGASSSCPDRDPGPRARRGSGGAGCPTGPDGPEGCGAGRTHAALIEILR
jgi:hypothetical protein